MAAIVVDASALVEAFVGGKPDPSLRRRLLTSDAAAPEQLTLEFLDVLRRLTLTGRVPEGQADRAVSWISRVPISLAHIDP